MDQLPLVEVEVEEEEEDDDDAPGREEQSTC